MITGIDFIWLPVTDMARARAFYEDVLGLPKPHVADFWVEYDLGPGPAVSLHDPTAVGRPFSKGGGLGLAFADFEGTVAKLRERDMLGMDPFETDGCHGGPSHDTEGNQLLIHQRKAEPTRDRTVDFLVLPVEDMARAQDFYENVLGLKRDSEGRGIWTEYVLPDDSALALFMGGDHEPNTGSAIGLRTPDLEAVFADLKARGLARLPDLVDTPVCEMGMVKDTEGNALVLHRHKPGHS